MQVCLQGNKTQGKLMLVTVHTLNLMEKNPKENAAIMGPKTNGSIKDMQVSE